MPATTLIAGQGLAGTLLGWALERAGSPFEIADPGHEFAASRVAAGIINPITGQRFVKSWRLPEYLPVARETYRAIEREYGGRIWRDMRVRRLFRSEAERTVVAAKQARGDFAPYVTRIDGDGFWIEGAAHVDTAALIVAARKRWAATGKLRAERVEISTELQRYDRVIDCRGVAATFEPEGSKVPWEFSKGESLVISIDGLEENEILNRGEWVLPLGSARARVGSTHQPGCRDCACTADARAWLERSAAEITLQAFSTLRHEAGVRVYLPDRHPVMGWSLRQERLGLFNGLGAKGALYGPAMAQAWAAHLTNGQPIDAGLDVGRFQQ